MSAEVSGGGGVSDGGSARSLSEITEEAAVSFGLDLVAAAKRNLRYHELWMPLISDLTVGPTPPMVLPPVDIEWIWFCHTLNPANYAHYCESRFSKLIGKPAIFNDGNEEYALIRCRDIWIHKYPSEPFENELTSDDSIPFVTNEDLLSQVSKQRNLYSKLSAPYMLETVYLIAARQQYKRFLYIMQTLSDSCTRLVPATDILLMWVSHQSYPTVYAADVKEMEVDMGKVVAVWEEVKEEEVKPPVYWEVVDDDVNTRYKSMLPRFLLEVCVYVKLDSKTKGMQGKTLRELLHLRMVRCHKELKIDKQISSFPLGSWQKAWHLYCEFGTRGVVLELRDRGGRCFEGSTMKDMGTFHWNDLL
ncbi:hypothetical protein Vadar_023938 [Vaccinium darrowii]|uniref:Uncharacterized protein n=1 Tax=Vaccinium darrowii TaxID=229202 RepID=A0ACB7Y2P5_9ERIC|nr:hypothetical protein Vadar_023938 [Vaccinium darrowii]